jgi:hypothetical protein
VSALESISRPNIFTVGAYSESFDLPLQQCPWFASTLYDTLKNVRVRSPDLLAWRMLPRKKHFCHGMRAVAPFGRDFRFPGQWIDPSTMTQPQHCRTDSPNVASFRVTKHSSHRGKHKARAFCDPFDIAIANLHSRIDCIPRDDTCNEGQISPRSDIAKWWEKP